MILSVSQSIPWEMEYCIWKTDESESDTESLPLNVITAAHSVLKCVASVLGTGSQTLGCIPAAVITSLVRIS